MSDTKSAAKTAGGAVGALFMLMIATILVVLVVITGGAGIGNPELNNACGGGGTAATAAGVSLTAEQMGNAQTIVTTTASRGLPAYAAVVAIATAYQESKLINDLRQLDYDSEGLFQQRVMYYTSAVADDPVRSTNAFLDRLVLVPHWQAIPLTVAAQTVQISAFPDAYAQWEGVANAVVGQLWPVAAATASGPTPAPSPGTAATSGTPTTTITVAVCAGAGGDGVQSGTGVTTTTIPAGFTINGSPNGIKAVQFALAQLGKPYVWGAAGPNSYDCSGLTMAAWATAGVALPHFTGYQITKGTPSPTNLSQASAGDLIFIPGADGTPAQPGHMGMYAGYVDQPDGRHLFIVEAPHTGDVVKLIDARVWASQIVSVRHIG